MAEEATKENGSSSAGNGSASANEKKEGFKLSFTKKSSVKKIQKVEKTDHRVELLVYDQDVAASAGKAVPSLKVIPKLDDTWRPEKRMKNLVPQSDITLDGTDARFVQEAAPDRQAETQYGLNLRERGSEDERDGGVADGKQPFRSTADLEDEKLRKDLADLPDEATLDQYESMPVEDFAEALLRGMGWERGKPIGRRNKVVVEPVQYERRESLLGIGAEPVPPGLDKKVALSNGDRRSRRVSPSRRSSKSHSSSGLSKSNGHRK